MTYEEEQQKLKRRLLARFRFKSLCRKVCANASWLDALEGKELGSDPKRNIAIINRRSAVKGILTLKEKQIFNTPDHDRSDADRELLRSTVMALKCFATIPPKIRETLVQSCTFQYLNSGRTVIREGHHSNAIYFVLDGELNVSTLTYSAADGKNVDEVRCLLVPGDMFGLEVIFECRRVMTCTTAINTELLCVYKEDLSPDLCTSLLSLWEQKEDVLKRFEYYFGHFTDHQISECCTFSKITQYNLDDVIFGEDDDSKFNAAYFVVSGECMILQCLHMTSKIVNKKKRFELKDADKQSNTKNVKPHSNQKSHCQFNEKTKFGVSKTDYENKATEEMEHIVFIDVGTLRAGSIFGIGEEMTDRSIVAKNVVQCLEIPRFWLFQRSQNIGNIWGRTKNFYLNSIPSRQEIFADYVKNIKWNDCKRDIVDEVFNSSRKL